MGWRRGGLCFQMVSSRTGKPLLADRVAASAMATALTNASHSIA